MMMIELVMSQISLKLATCNIIMSYVGLLESALSSQSLWLIKSCMLVVQILIPFLPYPYPLPFRRSPKMCTDPNNIRVWCLAVLSEVQKLLWPGGALTSIIYNAYETSVARHAVLMACLPPTRAQLDPVRTSNFNGFPVSGNTDQRRPRTTFTQVSLINSLAICRVVFCSSHGIYWDAPADVSDCKLILIFRLIEQACVQ